MAKRVVWIASAVVVIAVGTLFYVASSHTLGVEYPDTRLLSAVLLVTVAVAFRRGARRVARILLFGGSIALVIAYAHDLFIELGMRHQWFQLFGDGWVFYGYGEGREGLSGYSGRRASHARLLLPTRVITGSIAG